MIATQMPVAPADQIEQVVMQGDLSKLSAEQRLSYYRSVCESLGLNPLTRPFDYIVLNGKLTLYAKKDAADQLRKIHSVSIGKPDIRFEDDLIIVAVEAHDRTGRTDADVGVVRKGDMRGDVANALMKAITKAKRRVTLSICGLGMLDETEVETIPDAKPVRVEESGKIAEPPPPATTLGLGQDVQVPGKQASTEAPLAIDKLDSLVKSYARAEYADARTFERARGLAAGVLDEYAGDVTRRHTFLIAKFGKDSSKKLTHGEVKALLAWKDHPEARSEVNRVIEDYRRANGLQDLSEEVA